MRSSALSFFTIALAAATGAKGETLTPVYVVLGDQGQAWARVVVSAGSGCPSAAIDGGRPVAMTVRPGTPVGFEPMCELAVPANAKSMVAGGQKVALPKANPQKIVVFGDTGCRIVPTVAQDCNDISKWPLPKVSATAANAKPDLVVHVGDYLYRETGCPADAVAKCGGTPSGDNWETWKADFFAPAAKLLAAAPWAVSRGNHENCKRSWRGWFYYLDPRPMPEGCADYTSPYTVKLGKFELAMLDSSNTLAKNDEAQAAEFARELGALHLHPGAWLADHHPFWLVGTDPKGEVRPAGSATLQEAWERNGPRGVDVVLSGHTHLFAVLDFEGDRPSQIVAGDGGTILVRAPSVKSIGGVAVSGMTVRGGEMQVQFGYTLFEREGGKWKFTLRSPADEAVVSCVLTGRHARCE
jgi:predicted phosphodiesterase